jgi:16S rRNA (guanine966-N2)-methyltransferase
MAETRITGGEWRGRVIATPKGLRVRPTRSMVREAIFNIIGQDMAGTTVVDLFAGAGSVGFEALSRGAAHVTFVERHAPTLRLISATVGRFACAERVTLVGAEARSWVAHHRETVAAAGLVFLDAPYRDDDLLTVLETLADVAPPLILCEHHAARALPDRPGRMVRTRTQAYGLTAITFYGREGEDR